MPAPLPVIIDTDPGVDDALALLLAAGSPELAVLAVTTVGGNIPVRQATDNARRILPIAWAGREAPPLYAGSDGSSESAEFVHGSDGLGGVTLLTDEAGEPRYPPAAPVAGEAVEAILSLAAARPGEVTLVTLGPLTNVARAFSADAARLRLLRRIVVMGGAFRVPGNATPAAEFNVFADPEAAQVVCDSGIPILWTPLDASERCLLREDRIAALPDTPAGRFVRHITGAYVDHHYRGYDERACFLHDPLAVGAVLWPDLLEVTPLRVDVEDTGRLTRGMTVADFRSDRTFVKPAVNAEVCLGVDGETFATRFYDRLAACL